MKRDTLMRRESDANRALSATAKMRTLDVLHGEIDRERRKPSTIGERRRLRQDTPPTELFKAAHYDRNKCANCGGAEDVHSNGRCDT